MELLCRLKKCPPRSISLPRSDELLKFWRIAPAFRKLTHIHAHDPHWSFIDGPITAKQPNGRAPWAAAD